ncbi:Hypothetical predicted protein [Xyrichtys novacula]|uniref:Uncharacterized protein n=1 Tax=Xyrichtys novacula TaxID=13765 RepID=A0AAV1FQB2_XYRNO|nr:Hypothetical predicted protein [Xyrichtys novacula]
MKRTARGRRRRGRGFVCESTERSKKKRSSPRASCLCGYIFPESLSRRRLGDEEDGPVVLRRRVPRSGVRPLRRRAARRRRGAGKCALPPPSPGGVGPSALCKTGHPAGDGRVVSHPTRPFFSSAEPAPARRRRGRTRGSETTRPPLRGSAAETTRSTSTERSRKVHSRRRVPRSGVRPLRRRAARRRRGAGKCGYGPRPSRGGGKRRRRVWKKGKTRDGGFVCESTC